MPLPLQGTHPRQPPALTVVCYALLVSSRSSSSSTKSDQPWSESRRDPVLDAHRSALEPSQQLINSPLGPSVSVLSDLSAPRTWICLHSGRADTAPVHRLVDSRQFAARGPGRDQCAQADGDLPTAGPTAPGSLTRPNVRAGNAGVRVHLLRRGNTRSG